MNYRAEVTETTLNTVHEVLCSRIRKGYSAELVSCLIGKPNHYLDNAEFFRDGGYPPTVRTKLVKLLDLQPAESSAEKGRRSRKRIPVGMEKVMIGGYNTYVCTSYLDRDSTTRFLVQEPLGLDISLDAYVMSAYDLSIVIDAVYLMTQEGLLDQPMLAMEILFYINELLDMEINPYCLIILLEDACESVYDFKLMKVSRTGFFTYVLDQGFNVSGPEQ